MDSTNATFYSNRAVAYIGQKKWLEALEDAEMSIRLDPNFARGYQRKGQALVGQEKWVEAVKSFKKALEIDPNNAQLKKMSQDAVQQAQQAMMMETQQMLQEIFRDPIALCNSYHEISHLPNDPDFVKKVNEIRDDLSKFNQYSHDENVKTFYTYVMQRRQLEKMDPKEREALMKRERELLEKRAKEEEAERDRKRREEKERKEREVAEKAAAEAAGRTPEQNKALAIKEQANKLYTQKQFRDALSLYEEASALDPTNITYINNKSACYLEMGEVEKAREVALLAVDVGRENRADYIMIARALTRIGSTYMKEEDYEKAIEYFKKSLLDDRNANTLNLLRKAEKLRDEKKQKEYYSVELSQKAKEEGNEFYKKQKYAEAIKCYTEAVKRQPDNHVNYSNRAACFIKLMALPEALKDADKCIELDPKFAKGYLRKGQVHFLLKENQKALEAYDAGLKVDPSNAEIQVGIQKVLQQINSGSHDEESVKRNVERDPELQRILSDPLMRQVLDELRQNPSSAQHYLKDPQIRANLDKLIAAGIVSTK